MSQNKAWKHFEALTAFRYIKCALRDDPAHLQDVRKRVDDQKQEHLTILNANTLDEISTNAVIANHGLLERFKGVQTAAGGLLQMSHHSRKVRLRVGARPLSLLVIQSKELPPFHQVTYEKCEKVKALLFQGSDPRF
jgi:hypothetical protein